MNFNKQSPLHVVLLCLILIFQFSCSKDSDLLTDYVLTDALDSKSIESIVVDDTYQVSLSGSMVLDVLANDTFENEAAVIITETSTPTNGTVAINNDETLTYTPSAEIIEQVSDSTETVVGEVVDTFTYTAEVVNSEGTTTSEEASVVITAAREDAESLQSYGAVGDGVTDDTAAIQAAFDNETDITSDPNKTYLISGTLNLDSNNAQIIDFNGSTITRNTKVHWMINIDKRNYANTLTTIKNLKLDGNNKGGGSVSIQSRVDFQNVEIYDAIHDNANGIRMVVNDVIGVYGQSVFDNVDVHNLRSVNSDGIVGNNPGAVHGFLVSVKGIPSQTVQIVYKNSELYELWGEDAGGVTMLSGGLDTSNSPLSFWFENISVRDAQRRTVKNFVGNTTWINCTFTAAENDNPNIIPESEGGMDPAGLFAIGAASSSLGATNNFMCGCTFEGPPSDPFDGWFTLFIINGLNGPAGVEMRNSIFTGGHAGSWDNGFKAYGTLGDIIIANTTFGTTNEIRVVGTLQGDFILDTNNTYVDGKATVLAPTTKPYTEFDYPAYICPTIE